MRPLQLRPRPGTRHLPAGRAPGPQTLRSRGSSSFWMWACGIVGVGMILGGIFVAAGGRGSSFDAGEEALGGTIFALGGLIPALYAYSLFRRGRGPSLRGVTLELASADARRGGEVTVTATVGVADVEVGLVCRERYDVETRATTRYASTTVRQTRETTQFEEWRPVAPASGGQELTFVVPPDEPYSYEGDCVSYAWRVSARRVRTLRPDPRLDAPLWVEP